MKVLLRADADASRGTGHVMRCLTLAEALRSSGHAVELVGSVHGVDWLQDLINASGIAVVNCDADVLDLHEIRKRHPDWVVTDSYTMAAESISELNSRVPVLAIVDGDDRGIDATLYLDQNLEADSRPWRGKRDRFLLGAPYALVRNAVLAQRRDEPWRIQSPARVLAIMGGTDPTGAIVRVAKAILAAVSQIELTAIASPELHPTLEALGDEVRVLSPTPALPELFGAADIVVSAAGTSAWDICSLGIPAVFVALVENQRESLARLVEADLAFGVDAVHDGATGVKRITDLVTEIIADPMRREAMSKRALAIFDGHGASRVVARMADATWSPNWDV